MSLKHKLVVAQALLLQGLMARDLRRNRRAVSGLTAENVGYGLAVGGAIMALGALVGILFVPVATFPLIDGEVAAFLGAVLLIAGIIVHAAD